jgi:GNAT superfamily N-acetyltransferase
MQADVRTASLASPAAAALIAALDEEIQARYRRPLDAFYFSLGDDEVGPGRGAFALAWVGGRAVGCGAVRLIDDDIAELKRMYVLPESRRQGVAAAVLRFLEREAVDLGASRMVLETVTTPPDAIAVYRHAGYQHIPRFGPYVDSEISYCMAKSLVEPGTADLGRA